MGLSRGLPTRSSYESSWRGTGCLLHEIVWYHPVQRELKCALAERLHCHGRVGAGPGS